MEQDVQEALELVAGTRLKGGDGTRTTVNKHDVSIMRKMILLFLESLDEDMTVAELREYLDN